MMHMFPLHLVLVEADAYDGASIYSDAEGVVRIISNITGAELVESISDLDLAGEFEKYRADNYYGASRHRFLDTIRERLIDPDEVDEMQVCEDCQDFAHEDSGYGADHGFICDVCHDSYYTCEDCHSTVHGDYTQSVGDDIVCDRCYENNYSYCESCDRSYHHDNPCGCSDGCDCESPAMHFRLRNGDETIRQDERARISLPAGVISDEGIGAVARLIQRSAPDSPSVELYHRDDAGRVEWQAANEVRQSWYNLSYSLADIGAEWQTRDGNFTKRLSRFAYKNHGVRLPSSLISEVGNIGSQHSQGVDHDVEVTRDLNLSAYDFAHEDSCWWQSYYHGRCALKSSGGFGLRTFGPNGRWGNPVQGRAWVMPLRHDGDRLVPTFDAEGADAFVVFNGYGDLSGYAAARIVAQMHGMTYRKVGLSIEPMYINGDAGYLVGAEDIVAPYTDGSLTVYTDQHSNLFHTEPSRVAA